MSIKQTLSRCFPAVLAVVLSACGIFTPPQTGEQNDPLAGGDPRLSALSTGLSVVSTVPSNGSLDALTSVTPTITFSAPVDRMFTQRAVSVFSGSYDPANNPPSFSTLNLTSMCNGRWRVRNPNALPISFRWDVYNSPERGVGVVPANSDAFFASTTGQRTVRLFVGAAQQSVKAQNQTACTNPQPSFSWNPESTALTYNPPAPLTPGTYTLVVSAGARNAVNRLAEPYVLSFSTTNQTPVGRWLDENEGFKLFSAEKSRGSYVGADYQLWVTDKAAARTRLATDAQRFGNNAMVFGAAIENTEPKAYVAVRTEPQPFQPQDGIYEVNLNDAQ